MADNLRVLLTVVRRRTLARLEGGFAAFALMEHATWLAVLVYAYQRGGVSETGVAAAVQLVPAAVVAPLAAIAGDHYPRVRVLTAASLSQAICCGAVAVLMFADADAVAVYAAAAVLTVAVTFSRPAMGAVLPTVTETPGDLTAANVAAGFVENAGAFLGPALAGLVIHLAEPGAVFVGAAVLMLGAAALSGSIGVVEARAHVGDDHVVRSRFEEVTAGFTLLRTQRGPRLVVTVMAMSLVVVGALDVVFVVVAVELLERDEAVSGLLSAAAGLGGVVGAATSVVMVGRRRLTPVILLGSALIGLPLLALAGAQGVVLAMILLAVSGAGQTGLAVASQTLLQSLTPDDVLARVFGVLEGMAMASYAIGSVAIAALINWVGVTDALLLLGLALPIAVVLRLRGLMALDSARPEPDLELLGLVRSIGLFAPLPPYTLEQLATNLDRIEPAPDTILMRQGDPGDVVYLVADGSVTVERDGRVVNRCGPGEYYGEIALLRDVPRTATVTGHPRSFARAHAVAQERIGPVE